MPVEPPGSDSFTAPLLETLRRHPKRIVFPEADDPRVLAVAADLVRREAVLPILLGNRAALRAQMAEHGIDPQFINIIDPATSSDLPLFNTRYARMQKIRGTVVEDPSVAVTKPHHFAALMVQYGQADGMLAGNRSAPGPIYRAISQCVKPVSDVQIPAGAAILPIPRHGADDRLLILADCTVLPEPDPEQLASIAIEAGRLARHLLGRTARIAMLSHSTKGAFPSPSARRVQAATALARDRIDRESLDMIVEGEIQADVALLPSAAAIKTPSSLLHGLADVLVFPSLDAADISVRLLREPGGFQIYGSILLGLARPVALVPRGASTTTILGTTAAVAIEAIKFHDLHPQGDWIEEPPHA